MRMRRIVQKDSETGETLKGVVAYFVPRRQNGFSEGWFAMANLAFKALKMFTHLEEFRVLMALLELVDYENKIVVHQADIARELGMLRQNVSSAIKRLVEAGVILKGPKKGINCSYQLNPEFGWKGSGKNHVTALQKHREERMKAANITGVIENKDPKPQPNEDK